MRRAKVEPEAVAQEITALDRMPLDGLKQRWFDLHGREPPVRLGRALLTRGVAHRLQERAFGPLRPATARVLEQVVRDGASGRKAPVAIKPGTRLLRQWQGETHVVTVGENGVQYRGVSYRSLSEVARAITGARWSGPRFFGLAGRS